MALATMTDGIANMIMKAITRAVQTKIGMRFSDMPGARSLKMLVISSTVAVSAENSIKVIIVTQMSIPYPSEYSGPDSGT